MTEQGRETALRLISAAKAVELEQRATEPHPPETRAEFAAMALQWRRLAARAEIQERRTAAAARARQS